VKIIVDTNIVFSAVLSSRGKIGELLLNKPAEVEYLSPSFLLEELSIHAEKIIKLSRLSEIEYQQIKAYVIQHIEFVDANSISADNWLKASDMIKDLDEKDIPFLALAMEAGGVLWTGDKKLIEALKRNHYANIASTDTIYQKYFGL
jgi:predicted nucleic acid-binding protein